MENVITDKVNFLGFDCVVEKHRYTNQQMALQLVAADTEANRVRDVMPGAPVATATACVPSHSFSNNETVIKDYSENEGLLEVLLAANLIVLTGREVDSGFARCPIVNVSF